MTSWQTKEREAWQCHAAGLNHVKQKQHGWMVSYPDPAKSYDVLIVANGHGAALLERETLELCAVWSLGGGLLPRISNAAVAMGAEWLSCYDAGLVQMYQECGWEVVSRDPFDPLYAPADWPGTCFPDYVTMRR